MPRRPTKTTNPRKSVTGRKPQFSQLTSKKDIRSRSLGRAASQLQGGGWSAAPFGGGETRGVSRSPEVAPGRGVAGTHSATERRAEAEGALRAVDSQLVALLGAEQMREFAVKLEKVLAAPSSGETSGDGAITGVTGKTAAQRAIARKATLVRTFALRNEVLRDSLSTKEVAELFDVSRQTPHHWIAAGKVLGVKDRGAVKYPAWQFNAATEDGTINGLSAVLQELPVRSDLARAMWFVTPKRQLGGRRPIDALESDDIEPVIAEARASRAT